ncbi:hypothetical protein YC2023_039191 [Brassica napus]
MPRGVFDSLPLLLLRADLQGCKIASAVSKTLFIALVYCYALPRTKRNKTSLVVWNPYLGQTINNHKHKILRFFLDAYNVFLYEIYYISSDSWRVLDITLDWNIMLYHRGVSLREIIIFLLKKKIVFEARGPEEIAEPMLSYFVLILQKRDLDRLCRLSTILKIPGHSLLLETRNWQPYINQPKRNINQN